MGVRRSSIAAGDLRDRVTVRRKVLVSDGLGGFDHSWTTLANRIYANVRNIDGREAVIGQVLQGVSSFEITVRYRTDINVADQLLWGLRELNIRSAEDRDGLRTWTTIVASTEAAQGA